MSTVVSQSGLSLITGALRLIGAISAGEMADSADAQDGLLSLNEMLDSWNNDALIPYTVKIEDFAFVANKQTYTMGPTGDFNTDRPPRIERMSLIVLSNPTNPLELAMTYTMDEADWQQLLLKQTQSTWPVFCYDSGDFPLRSLNFWPVPRDVNNVRIYSWQALVQFSDLSTEVSMPPGYMEAIRYNLAVRLAPEYDKQVSQAVAAVAIQSLAALKSFNVSPKKLLCDDAVCGTGTSLSRARQEWFGIP